FVFVAAASATTLHATAQPAGSVLQRFLAHGDGPTVEYRALRHLEAHNVHFRAGAWMDAWTEYDHANGFRFQIIAEGGSAYIRKQVLRAVLEGDEKMWAAREPQRASFTTDNYEFRDGRCVEGLAS